MGHRSGPMDRSRLENSRLEHSNMGLGEGRGKGELELWDLRYNTVIT